MTKIINNKENNSRLDRRTKKKHEYPFAVVGGSFRVVTGSLWRPDLRRKPELWFYCVITEQNDSETVT